jgi:hypothetical protein
MGPNQKGEGRLKEVDAYYSVWLKNAGSNKNKKQYPIPFLGGSK